MCWEAAVTTYTREQIQQLDWENRSYIGDLVTIEEIVLDGGPHSWASAMYYKNLCDRLPVAVKRIKEELGGLTPEERAGRVAQRGAALKAAEGRARRYRKVMKRLRTEREAEERRLWCEAGGRA